nr:VWD domain-containing protein [Micromonospora sp. DSM 115978]
MPRNVRASRCLRITAAATAAGLLLSGCGWGRDDDGPPPDGRRGDRALADFLPPGVSADQAGDRTYQIRAWDAFGGDWGEGSEWSGNLTLSAPEPDDRVVVHEIDSRGSVPLPEPAVHLMAVGEGTAKVLTTPDGRRLGLLVAAAGRYGSILDLDGDDVVDVLDAITLDPPGRLVATNPIGEAYRTGLAAGTADCAGGGATGWDLRVKLVLDCRGEAPPAERPPLVTIAHRAAALPARAQLDDAVEAAITARDAAEAVTGAGAPPSPDDIADAEQFARDLERYGGAVLAGALLNDLLSDTLPPWAGEILGWIGEQTGADDRVDPVDAARLLSRSTDDLLDLARIQILLLGGDGGAADQAGGDASAGGCALTDAATGACYDGDSGNGSSWGEPHLRTFDGLDYDLQAVGEFVLARFADDDAEVQVRYRPYRNSDRLSVTGAVAVRTPAGVVRVAHPGDRAEAEVSLDGQSIEPGADRELGGQPLRYRDRTVQIGLPGGARVFVELRPALLDVTVVPAGRPVAGLLGDADGRAGNDLRAGDRVFDPADVTAAELYGPFADAWRLTDTTSVLPYGAGESTGTYTDRAFPAAPVTVDDLPARERAAATALCRLRDVVDPAVLAGCVLDVAATGDPDLAEAAAGAQRAVGRRTGDGFVEIADVRYPVRGWADRVDRAAAVAAGIVSKAPADVLGPRDARNVTLGEGDATCELPLELRLTAAPLRDGPGADLAVIQIGAGDGRYDVWIAAGAGWRWVGRAARPAAFDLAGILGPGESTDRVRLCDPPAAVDGERRTRSPLGPAIDAVAALGVTDAVLVPR